MRLRTYGGKFASGAHGPILLKNQAASFLGTVQVPYAQEWNPRTEDRRRPRGPSVWPRGVVEHDANFSLDDQGRQLVQRSDLGEAVKAGTFVAPQTFELDGIEQVIGHLS